MTLLFQTGLSYKNYRVVHRHRFDADPDPDPIPSLHLLENHNPLCFIFLVSIINHTVGVINFRKLEQCIKIFQNKYNLALYSVGMEKYGGSAGPGCRSGSGKMMPIRPDPHHCFMTVRKGTGPVDDIRV
jgi:hypothetical protein